MAKLMTNHEIVSDKEKNPVTSSDFIKHGNAWLNDAINLAAAEVAKKADKSYTDAELAKKANASDVTALSNKVDSKADASIVSQLQATVNTKADTSTVAALSEKVTANTTKTVDLQSQINNLVIEAGGDSNPEVVQARTDTAGVTLPTLKGRIDSDVAKLESEISDSESRLSESIVQISNIVGYTENKKISFTKGFYYDGLGRKYSNNDFKITEEPVLIKRGSIVRFYAKGYLDSVAMISICDEDNTTRRSCILSVDNAFRWYEIHVPNDGYYVFCTSSSDGEKLEILEEIRNENLNKEIVTIESDMTEVKNAIVLEKYIVEESIGTLINNKNVQYVSNVAKIVDGGNAYKIVSVDLQTLNAKYLQIHGTASASEEYGNGYYFIGDNQYVVEKFNLPNAGSNTEFTKYVEIPLGAKKLLVNGVDVIPSVHIASKKYENPLNVDLLKVVEKLVTVYNFDMVTGKYISSGDGSIINNRDFYYTTPIYIEKGNKVFINARGYLNNVAIFSKTNAENTSHTVLITSKDSVRTQYEYDVTETGYYCVCGNVTDTVTVNSVNLGVGNENKVDFCDLSLFPKFGVIGDSYASGELYYNQSYHDNYAISWGQIMARKHGTQCTNYSIGGLSTRTWLTVDTKQDAKTGMTVGGLKFLLTCEPDDIYYLALGINDYYHHGESYLGIESDMDTKSDTFYGNYAKIIEAIQNHAPNAKIVMFTCANTDTVPQLFNEAIVKIANHYNIPYIVQAEDEFFKSALYTNMAGGHPRAIAYSGMAMAFERLLNNCILTHWDYFKDAFMYD